MLFGVGVLCRVLYVYYLNVIHVAYLGWGRHSYFFCYRLFVMLLFLIKVVSSSSVCLEKVASFYFGTPWAFRITIASFR